MIEEAKNESIINERDRRVIFLVSKLTDNELFGLECYLAGTRSARKIFEKQIVDKEEKDGLSEKEK